MARFQEKLPQSAREDVGVDVQGPICIASDKCPSGIVHLSPTRRD